jgi:hypothetical protein
MFEIILLRKSKMTIEQFENDATRIARQHVEKRDLTLPSQPRLASMNKWHGKLLKAHVFFCFGVLILGYLAPAGARLLATLVSPLGSIVYSLNPYAMQYQFTGPLGDSFYRSFVGEAQLITAVTVVNYLVLLGGQYWHSPARLGEFALEQFGISRNIFTALGLAAVAALFALMTGFALYLWFGFAGPRTMSGAIKVHQLVLWGLLMPGAAGGFTPACLASFSGLCLVLRRIMAM